MRTTGILFVILVLASPMALAQGGGAPGQTSQPGQPAPPPGPNTPQRTPARPLRAGEAPPKGTAVLKGQVRMGETGAPVRRAQVRAQSMDGRGGGVTSTDANGNFEIRDLPAGRYTVVARKSGYAEMPYGQRRPNDPGTPIDLADGQTADRVNFVLTRGAVIAGTIVDDGGEPIAGAQVSAVRYQYMAGSRRLVPPPADGASDRTDDRGAFRLFGLPPGDYYISGTNMNYRFAPPGATNTEQEGFAPTYYPGTPNVNDAARISLKAGQEMSGANFALIVARMARVRGRALTSRGEPAAGSMAMLAPGDPFGMGMMNMSNAMLAADGTFDFANVAPGRYNLNIRPSGGMQNPNAEFAMLPITVGNDDIDNLIVTTSSGAIVRGVVTTDDGSAPPFRSEQVQVFAATVEPMAMMVSPGMNRINDDYSFEMTGLFGARRFNAAVTAVSGWYLKAVLYDGQDITDGGMSFEPARTYDGVTVVFTQKVTDLSGAVTDDRNQPVLDASVVIFPANRDRWNFQSRYVRALRPDTSGRFSIKNLPPGEDYLIIAVRNLEQGQGSDPEFLSRAREEARPFSLAEGEIKVVDVKLSGLTP